MDNKKLLIFSLIMIMSVVAVSGFLIKVGTTGKMIVWDYEGKPVEINGCRDSDGDSMSISGTCTDRTRTYSDSCIKNTVIEWTCGKSGNTVTGKPVVVWDFGQGQAKPQPEYKCYSKAYDCTKVRDWYGTYKCVSGKCVR